MNWGGAMVALSLVVVGCLTAPAGLVILVAVAWVWSRG